LIIKSFEYYTALAEKNIKLYVPSKGIASEVFGSNSATNKEKTVKDSKMVIPGKRKR